MANGASTASKKKIFISHRHEDKALANILNSTIRDWSSGDIKVYQSSDPGFSPIRSGGPVRKELETVLADVDVVLLIHTIADADWSWCLWEAGVATDGNPDHPDTTIIVFKCLEGVSVPGPFEDRQFIPISEEGIKKFTNDFHTEENFFSKRQGAFQPNISPDIRERRASNLYQQLKAESERLRLESTVKAKFIPRWIRVGLSLSLSEQKVTEIRQESGPAEAYAQHKKTVQKECKVLSTTDNHAMAHFDVDRYRPGMTLWELMESWKTAPLVSRFREIDWFAEVGAQMMQVIRRRPALEVVTPLKSAKETDTWYLPVINCAKSKNEDRDWEFILELYRLPARSHYIRLDLPDE